MYFQLFPIFFTRISRFIKYQDQSFYFCTLLTFQFQKNGILYSLIQNFLSHILCPLDIFSFFFHGSYLFDHESYLLDFNCSSNSSVAWALRIFSIPFQSIPSKKLLPFCKFGSSEELDFPQMDL